MRQRTIRAVRRQHGLTVTELLIALALVGLILSASSAMLLQAYTNESVYRIQNNAQQSTRTALGTIADDLKQARRSAATVTIGGISASMPTNTVIGAANGSV